MRHVSLLLQFVVGLAFKFHRLTGLVVHFIKRGKTASIKDNLKYLKRFDFDWSKLTVGREKPLVITVLIRQIE